MLFEVSKTDIQALDDSALRELIGRLCQSEAQACGIGSAAVHFGGDQNASDGGVDVEANFSTQCLLGGYVPKGHTVFQVKKPSMPPSAIQQELCPHGKPRPIFDALAQEHGNYIIVSSADDVSSSAQKKRVTAMKTALGSLATHIHVDFYDASALMNWCNQYPAVVCWVKHTFGLESIGWQPYGDWSGDGSHVGRYLIDEARLQTPGNPTILSAKDGLIAIREILGRGGSSIRLTGLSGVGKTRFVQALFENDVVEGALPADKVLYLDRQNPVEIPPLEMVDILSRTKLRIFVVVDNCSAKEHRYLTKKCVNNNNTVSLLTVEYDVQDDEPEDSKVYRMLPSSDECINRLLEQRFPDWSSESCRRIARLAGGNARIAIALAKAAQQERDFNALSDRDLFQRIFWQKGQPNEELHRTAKVCSLVYSFAVEGENQEKPQDLACLSALSELSPETLYRNISQLEKKQLVQSRGVWRAVLPHALSNRLAKEALDEIPIHRLLDIVGQGTPHMLRSFSKRLSYLHDSPKAQAVFREWLTLPPLSSPDKWNEMCHYRLEDAAPVIPEDVLEYLETQSRGETDLDRLRNCFDSHTLQNILIQLAYEPDWFDRSVMLLVMIIRPGPGNPIGCELFQIIYSGTHAPLSQRLSVIRRLLNNPPAHIPNLGVNYLEAAMRSGHNLYPSMANMHDFGTRRRDSGWYPHTHEDALAWYREVVAFIQEMLPALPKTAQDTIQKNMADSLHGLWISGLEDAVAHCCRCMSEGGDWWQGWIGLGQIKEFRWEDMTPGKRALLSQLLDMTEPKKQVNRAVCLLSTEDWSLQPFFPCEDSVFENQALTGEIQALGRSLAKQPETLQQLLALIKNVNINGACFGEGLAEGEPEAGAIWPALRQALEDQRDTSIQLGYLKVHFARNPTWVLELLSEVEREGAVRQAVYLQSLLENSVELLTHIVELLMEGKLRLSDIAQLQYLIGDSLIREQDFTRFIEKVCSIEGGLTTAVEFLATYCRRKHHLHKMELSPELQSFARPVILAYMRTAREMPRYSYQFYEFVADCFETAASDIELRDLFQAAPAAFISWQRYVGCDSSFLTIAVLPVARNNTEIFLDVVVKLKRDGICGWRLTEFWRQISNVLNALDVSRTIVWADTTEKRLQLAELCRPFLPDGTDRCKWSDLALALLHTADGPVLLKILLKQFSPDMWSGSRADILRCRLVPVRELAAEAAFTETVQAVLPQLELMCREADKTEAQWSKQRQSMYQQFEY